MISSLSKQKNQLCLLLLLVLTLQSSFLAAADQYKPRSINANADKKHPDLMQNYKKIENPVSFGDLPIFKGRTRFACGYFQPEQNGVCACQMKFYAEEAPQVVLDFYKQALISDHWQIIHAAGTHITASHPDGHMCTVNVTESRLPKTKSKYTIAYRQLDKQR